MKDIKLKHKLIIVFVTALALELNSISGFHYLMQKNWIGMFLMAFVNPLISLPMNHFSIECKSFKERLYIALAFSLGFGIGVVTIRPFII
jgi:hypothetical protein